MSEQEQDERAQSDVITREDVITQIEARLNGNITDVALAKWAFDRFYAEEVGDEDYDADDAAIIADALDILMFGDDPAFRQTEEELRALIARLSKR